MFLLLLAFQITFQYTHAVNPFCKLFTKFDAVKCVGDFPDIKELTRLIGGIRRFSTFELHKATLDALPPDLFRWRPPVQRVIFDQVDLKFLSIPELGESPFAHLRESIERFEIYDSKEVFAWNFTSIPSLTNLKTLVIEKSAMISVPEIFPFAPDLRFVDISGARIKFVSEDAFRRLENITSCSLARNEINTMRRSMFPKHAWRLRSIDLSRNKINSLPEDIFDEMPLLREVKLHNNQLQQTLPVQKIWEQLMELWIHNNNLLCDQLCWTVAKENRPMFFDAVKCRYSGQILYVPESCKGNP